MMQDLIRKGFFGGFLKIHQIFEDRRNQEKETPKAIVEVSKKQLLTLAGLAVLAVTVWAITPDRDSAN